MSDVKSLASAAQTDPKILQERPDSVADGLPEAGVFVNVLHQLRVLFGRRVLRRIAVFSPAIIGALGAHDGS